ncbi:MAG: molybdopterin molybdotransferase MoeA [Robiginitomaculum sp.]|nr:molybdopterin molybdotransferase MoeA [Robiginitomaculum sp.]MDQ7077440.1 molybdopterin molybdotransferase MoeA [Robiginitomaculum sp.]
MISYDEALALIAKEAAPLDTEAIAPAKALGRVLAAGVVATRSLPPFDNTAMDGFALRAKDSQNAPCDLPVLGSVAAGDVPAMAEEAGAVEIMTGAPVPNWCDCIVPVENVDVVRDETGVPTHITVKAPITKGAHIRRAGEDVQAGQSLIAAGASLTPQSIAVLTALGVEVVSVVERPRIALIGTGAEVVRDPATDLKGGQIYDSNTPYLRAALRRDGFEAQVIPGSPDDTADFLTAMAAAKGAKIIISTGAVSMGRRDFVPEALAQLGARIVFHKCTIRPGKPILFARLPDDTYFFGLPGNPVSAAVGLAFFVMPLLDALLGRTKAPAIRAPLVNDFSKKQGFTMFTKARLGAGGIEILPGQQSFRLAPLLVANGWAVIPAGVDGVKAGDEVDFVPFERGALCRT